MAGKNSRPQHKRIIVACDGTWVNSDNGWERESWKPWDSSGHLTTASNVTRLCRALKPTTSEGIQQICYYQGGLGSANSFWSFFFGGYFGQGISENIREAYSFICNNYEAGDEIILTGFSRGAFTARSIAGLISSVGLLTRPGLNSFYTIFQDWEHQADKNFKSQYGTAAWPVADAKTNFVRPKFRDPAYVNALVERGLTRANVPIKAIGVWDSVGSLGVPTIKLFNWLPIHTDQTKEFSFINTEVAPMVENAYQALALDERRSPFEPSVWETPAPDSQSLLQELKQTWFPGVHSSIGGGYEDTSISNITLAWMLTNLGKHVAFDPEYIPTVRQQNEEWYGTKNVPVKSWALGLITRSDTGPVNALTGKTTRTPGEYHPTNPDTGLPYERKMRATHEFIHPSVRYRLEQKGAKLGESKTDVDPKGPYKPMALTGWNYISPDETTDIGGKEWVGEGKWYIKHPNGEQTYIVEDRIEDGTFEKKLIDGWPGCYNKLYPPLS